MGMDVYGKNPSGEKGEYFRNNVWWWHPLWDYCEALTPDLIPEDNLGHYNDGWGLDAAGAKALAERLLEEIESGRTLEYKREYFRELAALPDEACKLCAGTGVRVAPATPVQSDPPTGGSIRCGKCQGKGKVRPFVTNYPFSVQNVREFAEFLSECGGFSIC